MTILSTIAVDLTPVTPGGNNGGAKVFVIALIKQLATMKPQTNWILLTQSSAHKELCDDMHPYPNIQCRQVVISNQKPSLSKFAKFLFRLQHIPYTKSMIKYFYYFLCDVLKRTQTRNILRDLHADLLFCPFTAPTFSIPKLPTVCVIYDIQFKTYPHFFDEESLFYRSYAFMRACQKARVLIAVSDYTHQSILHHHKEKPREVVTIHIHLTPTQLSKQLTNTPSVLKEFGLESQKYVLYPANFWKHKNHEMLLTAFQMFVRNHASHSSIKLVCTGAPDARQQWLQQAANQMGLAAHTVFPGYVTSAQLQHLMQHAAGLIFPSLYEGFGLPLIEAMAAGVPVTCSNCTSMPEVAGDAALLFSPTTPHNIYQALKTVVFDEAQRATLIERGTLRAKAFSYTTDMANRYWDSFILAKNNCNNPSMTSK